MRERVVFRVLIFEGVVAVVLLTAALGLAFSPWTPSEDAALSRASVMLTPAIETKTLDEISPRERARPTQWLPSRGDECSMRDGTLVCQGPRRVPRPHGAAAALAEELGLGTEMAARTLMRMREPPDEWVLAVTGQHREELRWPVPGGRLWRGFHQGWGGGRGTEHAGVDFGAPAGTSIVAVADGLVAYSDNEVPGYGNLLVILHIDGTVALYAHCRATYVFAGEQVRAGDVIGEVGDTGIAHGAHLHFELRRNGVPFDPMPRMSPAPG